MFSDSLSYSVAAERLKAELELLKGKLGTQRSALEPANASYEVRILPPNRVKIQGKLIGLYRKY